MKYLCNACERLVELSQFRVDAGELVAVCEKCGVESRARVAQMERRSAAQAEAVRGGSAPAPRANVLPMRPVLTGEASDFTAVPGGYCPKCIALRVATSASCPHCGLVYDNFRPDELSLSQELAVAWRALVPRWSEPEQHDVFLSLALSSGELAAAGRLYRIRLVRDPADALAQRGRDEVVRLALIPSLREPAAAPPTAEQAQRRKLLLGALVLLFALGCFLALFMQAFP